MKRFYFHLLKTDRFCGFTAFLNKQKLKGKFSDNLGKNNCGVFHFLAQSVCTTSEMELNYNHQKVNVRVASQVAKQLKTWNLKKLWNFKKIPEMLWVNGEYPAVDPRAKFWRFFVKSFKKSALKHSKET